MLDLVAFAGAFGVAAAGLLLLDADDDLACGGTTAQQIKPFGHLFER